MTASERITKELGIPLPYVDEPERLRRLEAAIAAELAHLAATVSRMREQNEAAEALINAIDTASRTLGTQADEGFAADDAQEILDAARSRYEAALAAREGEKKEGRDAH